MWGPPDEVDSHPPAASMTALREGGGETSTYPFEDWRYRYLEGIGENVELEFVDPTVHRRISPDHGPQRKRRPAVRAGRRPDAWRNPWGLSSKTPRFKNTDGTHVAQPLGGMTPESNGRI